MLISYELVIHRYWFRNYQTTYGQNIPQNILTLVSRELTPTAEMIFHDVSNSHQFHFKFPKLPAFWSHIQFTSYFMNFHCASIPHSIINSLILPCPVDWNLLLTASTLLLMEGSRIIYWASLVYLNLSIFFPLSYSLKWRGCLPQSMPVKTAAHGN